MKDELDHLFQSNKNSFDDAETPVAHQARFMKKLHKQAAVKKTTKKWMLPLSIAASIVLLVCLGIGGFSIAMQGDHLASLSPEMLKTESFFKSTITIELQKLQTYNDPELKEIISETLTEIELLETQYVALKYDLTQSGNDNRVIAAMISNFQDRINLLQEVQETLKDIKQLKQTTDENIF